MAGGEALASATSTLEKAGPLQASSRSGGGAAIAERAAPTQMRSAIPVRESCRLNGVWLWFIFKMGTSPREIYVSSYQKYSVWWAMAIFAQLHQPDWSGNPAVFVELVVWLQFNWHQGNMAR
jgi:hypothetical protein